MRFFYDTEFIENGRTVELISIGIVSEAGAEYYACSTDFNPALAGPWVRENVIAQLPKPSESVWKSKATIRDEVADFLLGGGLNSKDERPELWAWVGGYDHFVYAGLFGDMSSMPEGLPRFTHELKQYWEMAGRPWFNQPAEGRHDALVDARNALARFKLCMKALPIDRRGAVIRGAR